MEKQNDNDTVVIYRASDQEDSVPQPRTLIPLEIRELATNFVKSHEFRIVSRRPELFTIEAFRAEIEEQIRHFYKCCKTVGPVDAPLRYAVQKAAADAEEIAYKKVQRAAKATKSRREKSVTIVEPE